MLTDALAYLGHEVHVVRAREVGTLLGWLGPDLRGRRLLDVAGGDGYWAGKAGGLGAVAVCLDIDRGKLRRGRRLRQFPQLVLGDALRLPFRDGAFDAVMSVCAIEHFAEGGVALDEMTRVLRTGGELVMSADTLSRENEWPALGAGHRRRYHVVHTYTHEELARLLEERSFEVLAHGYIFRGSKAERLYLQLSRFRLAWNLAAPLAPLVRRWERGREDERGSVVLIHARRR